VDARKLWLLVEARLGLRLLAMEAVLVGLAAGLMEDVDRLVSMASRGPDMASDIRNLPLNSWRVGKEDVRPEAWHCPLWYKIRKGAMVLTESMKMSAEVNRTTHTTSVQELSLMSCDDLRYLWTFTIYVFILR
jgi:hypothetical protein